MAFGVKLFLTVIFLISLNYLKETEAGVYPGVPDKSLGWMFREAEALITNGRGTKDARPGSENYYNAPRFCNDGNDKYWTKQAETKSFDIGPWKEPREFCLKSTDDLRGRPNVECKYVIVGERVASNCNPASVQETYHRESDAASLFGDSSSTRRLARTPSRDTISSFGGDGGSTRGFGSARPTSWDNGPTFGGDSSSTRGFRSSPSPSRGTGSTFGGDSSSTRGLGLSRRPSSSFGDDSDNESISSPAISRRSSFNRDESHHSDSAAFPPIPMYPGIPPHILINVMYKKANEMLWKGGESISDRNIRPAPKYCKRGENNHWLFTYPTERYTVGKLAKTTPRTFSLAELVGSQYEGRQVKCYVVISTEASPQDPNAIWAPLYPDVPDVVVLNNMFPKAREMLWEEGESSDSRTERYVPKYCNSGDNNYWLLSHPLERKVVGPLDREVNRKYYLEETDGYNDKQTGRAIKCYLVLSKITTEDISEGPGYQRPNSILGRQRTVFRESDTGSLFRSGSSQGQALSRRPSFDSSFHETFHGDSDAGSGYRTQSTQPLGLSRRPSIDSGFHETFHGDSDADDSSFRTASTPRLGQSRRTSFNMPRDAPEPPKAVNEFVSKGVRKDLFEKWSGVAATLIFKEGATQNREPGSRNYRDVPRYCNHADGSGWHDPELVKKDIGPWEDFHHFYLKEDTTPIEQSANPDTLCYLVLSIPDGAQGSGHMGGH